MNTVTGAPKPPKTPVEQWEYKVLFLNPEIENKLSLEEQLNKLGAKGWQLVVGALAPEAIMYTFKRRKQANG